MNPSEPAARVTTRLAPSPTGWLHLGHARSFALAWLHARAQGGRVLLRIEDLDRERCKPEFVDAARADLAWLGLDWDGPELLQSRDPARYRAALEELRRAGRAYACVCTRREIASGISAPHAGEDVRYAGRCRGRFASLEAAQAQSGRAAGLRFATEAGVECFDDELQGPQRFEPASEVGDFLLMRRDGAIAYQLAVVVDDAAGGVTDVVRAADLLPSTARQRQLQRALALPHPRCWHVPLVLDANGERLAKRAGSLALAALRARGVDPRAVLAWALRSAGLPAPQRIDAGAAIVGFEFARIRREPHRMDTAELDALLEARA